MAEIKGDSADSEMDLAEIAAELNSAAELTGLKDDETTNGGDSVHSRTRKKVRKMPKNERDMIKHVSIADAATGVVLVEKVYKWHENAQTQMCGSLALALYQFAREVDDGSISSVNFETHSVSKHRRQASMGVRARSLKTPSETMKMVCCKGPVVIVSIFYDMKGGLSLTAQQLTRLNEYLEQVTRGFVVDYTQTLEKCRDEVRAAAEADEVNPEQMQRIRAHFNAYESTIENLRLQFFPQEPAHGSHGTPPSGPGSIVHRNTMSNASSRSSV